MRRHEGAHPCIGALDVCPAVWLRPEDREAARAEALAAARGIAAEAQVPVFLYGELAQHPSHRERAFFRTGGLVELRRRLNSGELKPDFGPPELHPSAGATLVTARPPLAAFNVELEGAGIEATREIAERLRESGGGLPGVRALGIDLGRGRTQVSTNVHDPIAVPLAEVVERVGRAGGSARRASGVGRDRRARPRGRSRRPPARPAAARLRPRPARDRAAATICSRLSPIVAQTGRLIVDA